MGGLRNEPRVAAIRGLNRAFSAVDPDYDVPIRFGNRLLPPKAAMRLLKTRPDRADDCSWVGSCQ